MTCRDYWNCLDWDQGTPCPCFPAETASSDRVESNSLRSFSGTPNAYTDLISDAWDWKLGNMYVDEVWYPRRYWQIRLVSGDSDANRNVLAELTRTRFYMLFWESIQRGGLHTYHVPREQWDTVYAQLGEL